LASAGNDPVWLDDCQGRPDTATSASGTHVGSAQVVTRFTYPGVAEIASWSHSTRIERDHGASKRLAVSVRRHGFLFTSSALLVMFPVLGVLLALVSLGDVLPDSTYWSLVAGLVALVIIAAEGWRPLVASIWPRVEQPPAAAIAAS
jgi:hypothetical protein